MKKLFFIQLVLFVLVLCKTSSSQTWEVMQTNKSYTLKDVWGFADDDVYAVGENGIILHYDGSVWSPMNSGIDEILLGVWGASADCIYAVGGNPSPSTTSALLKYNGQEWTRIPTQHASGYSNIWGFADNNVYLSAGGVSKIVHFDGTNFTDYQSGIGKYMMNVWGTSNENLYVVDWQGNVHHYDGNEWDNKRLTYNQLEGIWGAATDDVYACGGSGKIYHFDGTDWTQKESNTNEDLIGIAGNTSDNVYAVGRDGTVVHYDGANWSLEQSNTPFTLRKVWVSPTNKVFAVGDKGTIACLSNENIKVQIGEIETDPCKQSEVLVPVDITLATTAKVFSGDFSINYHSDLIFNEIVTTSSLIENKNWNIQFSNKENKILISTAGSEEIIQSGTLLYLKFTVSETRNNSVLPIELTSAIIDEKNNGITTIGGSIKTKTAPTLSGDVTLNESVSSLDASYILQFLVDKITLDCQQKANADVSYDGTISALDASYILKYKVGQIPELPYRNEQKRKRSLTETTVSMNDYTITNEQFIDIPVFYTANNTLALYSEFEYNKDLLRLKDVIWSDLNTNIIHEQKALEGVIKIACISTDIADIDHAVYTLRFEIIGKEKLPATTVFLKKCQFNEDVILENIAQSNLNVTTNIETQNATFSKMNIFPNPVKDQTQIQFTMKQGGNVLLNVYSMEGKLIRSLINKRISSGDYNVAWDCKNQTGTTCDNGTYIIKLKTGQEQVVQKIILIK